MIYMDSQATLSLVIESMSFTHSNGLIYLYACLDITVDKTAIVMFVLKPLEKTVKRNKILFKKHRQTAKASNLKPYSALCFPQQIS